MQHLKKLDINLYTFKDLDKIDPNYGYHVTSRKNLESIMKNGLEPRVPEDYGTDGDTKGVYLFKTLMDTRTALESWFGHRLEEIEEKTGEEYDEVILKVNIKGLKHCLIDSVDYEWTCVCLIEPERIEATIGD